MIKHIIIVLIFVWVTTGLFSAFAVENETHLDMGIEWHSPTANSNSLLNPNHVYNDQNYRYNTYILFKNRYFYSENLSSILNILFERVDDDRINLNTYKNDSDYYNIIVNDAALSYKMFEHVYIDLGKMDVKTGTAFFKNPTDFLFNPSHVSRKGRISYNGSSLTDPYREGSFLAKSEYFTSHGALSLIYVPKFASPPEDNKDITDQRIWERINSQNLCLVKWNSAGSGNLNADIIMMLGDRWGIGAATSTDLDKIILNIEASLKNKAPSFAPSSDALNRIRSFQFPSASEVFTRRDADSFYFEGTIGLDYRSSSKYNLILEYYYNQAGLSRNEWNHYFDFLKLLNSYSQLTNSSVYKDYIGLFTEKNRIQSYSNLLPGEHYMFLHLQKDDLAISNLSVSVNFLFSFFDYSGFINGQIDYLFNKKWKIYAGAGTTIGDSNTEFGINMIRSDLYVGVNYLW